MSKNYDLLSESDMSKFIKDLENELVDVVQGQLDNFACDNCKNTFKAHIGLNHCPHCNQEIMIYVESK